MDAAAYYQNNGRKHKVQTEYILSVPVTLISPLKFGKVLTI